MIVDQWSQKYFEDESDAYQIDKSSEGIQWKNLVFVPFHPLFKFIILCVATIMSMFGPILSIGSTFLHCGNLEEESVLLYYIFYFFINFATPLYLIDIFLQVMHRQVPEITVQRVHVPKSGVALLTDIIAIIPFISFVTNEDCLEVNLWPNILTFNQTLLIYRVVEYFKLKSTHSLFNILCGFTLIIIIILNCFACIVILVTISTCPGCPVDRLDWRLHLKHLVPEYKLSHPSFELYSYVTLMIVQTMFWCITTPVTVYNPIPIAIMNFITLLSYFVLVFVLWPKLFGEALLRLRKMCAFQRKVLRVIEEARRRNEDPVLCAKIEHFYRLVWAYRSGITGIPQMLFELPIYLRKDIKTDLTWPIFHHSPTFRRTSDSYHRWIATKTKLYYKTPGEVFNSGVYFDGCLFYLKTGIVQFISADDGKTPVISISSGSVIGEINFLVPPLKQKMVVLCLTYCEFYVILRKSLIQSLQKFPKDRNIIYQEIRNKLSHARNLYILKKCHKITDRRAKEGIYWFKFRWRFLSSLIAIWKHYARCLTSMALENPAEDSIYHCSKYIGQIVLCKSTELKINALFIKSTFPWVINLASDFIRFWRAFVQVVVFIVLIVYPPSICVLNLLEKRSFKYFRFWTAVVFIVDIFISLVTPTPNCQYTTDIYEVIFARLKTIYFLIDVLSTPLAEVFITKVGMDSYQLLAKFSPLLKIYFLFDNAYNSAMHFHIAPFKDACFRNVLLLFSFVYISGNMIFLGIFNTTSITKTTNIDKAELDLFDAMNILVVWYCELSYHVNAHYTVTDVYVKLVIVFVYFLITLFVYSQLMAIVYLKNREIVNLQSFMKGILERYKEHNLPSNLLERLKTYFFCHWKMYQSLHITHVNDLLKDEPTEIYYDVYGKAVEVLLSKSKAFLGANPHLIKEIAMNTKFIFIPKNSVLNSYTEKCEQVLWVLRGEVVSEHEDFDGETVTTQHPNGELLSLFTVFFFKRSLKSFQAKTDCEIVYIDAVLFNKILSRYPLEKRAIEICVEEITPAFEAVMARYAKRLDRALSRKHTTTDNDTVLDREALLKLIVSRDTVHAVNPTLLSQQFFTEFSNPRLWIHPHTKFYRIWMPLRVITVVISVLVCVAKGTYAAKLRKYLHIFTLFCDLFTWIDIILKFFLAYYNEKGILITNLRKTSAHYMMRGFVPDVIGVIPWGSIVAYFFTTPTTQSTTLLYDSYSRTLHVYLFLGYCNYWCDSPDANLVPMMIFKWQVLSFIMVNVMAHHLSIYCMDIVWDSHTFDYIRTELVMYDNETCFFIGASANMNDTDLLLHWISAKSFIISQFSFLKLIISKAVLEGVAHVNVLVVFLMLGTESLFWCVEIYTITMLVLSFRGPSLYEDNIDQLIVFLKNERVEEELINNVRTYFKYWWYRTHGMDVINPMMERVGLQLRQEISFQLFEITFQNLSHTLPISPHVKRHLACVCQVVYFLPRQDIIREMNLVPFVYIVYRGQVGIFKNGVKVNTLKKGAMFGHLRPGKLRPVVITAKTEQSTDVLQIPVDSFFRYIEDETLKGIFDTPESENNYIPLQRYFTEFGEETIQYLMRGVPSIRFPRSTRVISIRDSKWFSAWLTAVWLVTPALASFFTFIRFCNCPDSMRLLCRLVNLFTDIIHFIYVVVDFSFAQQLVVIGGKCRYRPIKWKKFKSVRIYTDIISLVVPKFRFVPYTKTYLNLARCLRLQYFYVFYQHFCTNFQSKTKTIAVFLVSIMLATHAIVCLELLTSCEDFDDVIKSEVPSSVVKNIIGVAFIPSDMREGGCVLTAHTNYTPSDGGPPRQALYTYKYKDWYGDYLCTLSELIQQDMMVRDLRDYDDYFSRWEIFLFGSIKSYALYFMNFLIMSKALTYIYIKFRKMFHYDHDCRNLEIFLLNVKLTYTLFQSVQMYLKKFWQRQKATGTPELVKRAPQCLKQDIMCSLYLHHLTLPGTFRDLPRYFLRQLTAKMHRTIIFPGKDIVKEGDILPVIFFIHEGEVEKYYLNKNSEKRVVTLLTTTGYFELMPVIFPNTPYQFSYQSKTVVDLVYLRNQDWTLLLDIYPEVKKYIYQTARSSKESMVKHP